LPTSSSVFAAVDAISESNLRSSALGFCGPACAVMLPVMLFRIGPLHRPIGVAGATGGRVGTGMKEPAMERIDDAGYRVYASVCTAGQGTAAVSAAVIHRGGAGGHLTGSAAGS
jgi:hypothetical protein